MQRYTLIIISCFITTLAFAAPDITYQIKGLSGDLLKNAQARLAEHKNQTDKPLTESSIKTLYSESSNEIRKAIEPFGYFKPEITSQLYQQHEQWHAVFHVEPGPLLTITNINTEITGEGKDNFALQRLLKHFPLKIGRPLLMSKYSEAKQKLFAIASQEGYLNAKLTTHTILIDRKHYTVIITLILDTGPRYYFGQTSFAKNPLSEQLLQRFLPYKPGEPYSTTKVVTLQDDLNNSGYFQQASVTPLIEENTNYQVPIDVSLTPRKSQQYLVGAGYGTDTGVRGIAAWEWRYLNPMGHRMSAGIQLSQIQTSAQATYSIPGNHPAIDRYDFTGSILQNIFPTSTSITQQLGFAAITSNDDWQRTLGLNYKISRFRFDNQTTEISHLLIPSVTWRKLSADNTMFTKNGNRFTFNLQGASDSLLSDTNFFQIQLADKFIRTPYKNTRIILQGNLSYTAAHDYNRIPPELRFYAGGSQNMRGYNFQQLGPGRYLTFLSAEAQYQIFNKWYAGIFYEVGNAYDHLPMQLQQDAGISLTWTSPVGSVHISLAKSTSEQGKPVKLQFYMGPDLG